LGMPLFSRAGGWPDGTGSGRGWAVIGAPV
jgi:hypothetical protein